MKEKKTPVVSLLVGAWLVFGIIIPLGLVITFGLYRLAYWLVFSPILS